MFIIIVLDCLNGDVKIAEDDVPMIYWKGLWVPICGNYFWNNQILLRRYGLIIELTFQAFHWKSFH